MRLHQLKNVQGAVHRRKRVGTGEGGGRGKTSGRGGKGQTARTGGGIRIGFEGGQMPIYRRLPMRGFTNIFRVEYTAVHVGDLARVPADVSEITGKVLVEAGILRPGTEHFKVLSDGEVTRAFTVHAPRFSSAAKAKIEAAGGKAVATEAPRPPKEKKVKKSAEPAKSEAKAEEAPADKPAKGKAKAAAKTESKESPKKE